MTGCGAEAISTDNYLPRLCAGVASGVVVSRADDWFGSPVKYDELGHWGGMAGYRAGCRAATFHCSYAGLSLLMGIKSEVTLFRVRRGRWIRQVGPASDPFPAPPKTPYTSLTCLAWRDQKIAVAND